MNFSKTLNRTLNFIFVEAEFNLGFSVILVKISVKLVLKQRFCCFIAAKYCCPAARSVYYPLDSTVLTLIARPCILL